MNLPFSKPQNGEAYIRLIIKILLAAALFTPLFYAFNFYFPYIVVKNLIFRAIIEIAFAFYLFLLVRNKSYWPQFNKSFPILILFVFTLFISSLLGGNFTFSFWSNFERMDGLVTWLHILIYIFTLIGILRTKEEWRAFFNVFLGVAWLVAIYGFLQYGQAKGMSVPSFIKDSGLRIYSTFGNAAYLGSYMLISVMLAFYFFVYYKNKTWQWFDKNFWIIIYYISSIIVFFVSMILSQTRASLLGLLAFGFFMYISYLWFNRSQRDKFYYILLSLFIVSFVSIGFVFQQKNANWVQSIGLLNRMTSIKVDDTTLPRLLTWKNSVQGFKEKPIIGWGEENFKYVYDKYFPIGVYQHQTSEVWFDRPHNILMQHLIHGGAVGFILYLAVFFYLIFILYKNYTKYKDPETRRKHWFFNFFWISFLLAYLVHDFFIFDNLNINVILYLTLAQLFTIGTRVKKPSLPEFKFGTQKDWIFSAVIFLIWINIFIFMIYYPWKSNRMLISALNGSYQAQSIEDANEVVDTWLETSNFTSLGDKERVEIAVKMLNGFALNRGLGNEDKQRILANFAEMVHEDLFDITNKYPNDVRMKMFLVQFYDMTQNHAQAIEVLEDVKEIAPYRPESYINLSQKYLQLNDIDRALENIEHFVSIMPKENRNTYVYWNALQVNLIANNIEKTNEYLNLIKEANQFRYSYNFKDGEINILRDLLTKAEENEDLPMIEMLKTHIE